MKQRTHWRGNIAIILCAIAFASAAAEKNPAKIGASATWSIPAQFLSGAHAACDKAGSSDYPGCMIDQMTKAGAPADAVSFTRELYRDMHGEFGLMTGFQQQGPVAFAWIMYPLRANTNYGLLIVNGAPRIVDIEDMKLLDTKSMKRSFQFSDLKGQFPKVDVWPGDRDGKTWPNSQAGPNGGIQFAVEYPLINGCHACARAGFAVFNWNFDARGKFLGTSFQGLIPPPLQ